MNKRRVQNKRERITKVKRKAKQPDARRKKISSEKGNRNKKKV